MDKYLENRKRRLTFNDVEYAYLKGNQSDLNSNFRWIEFKTKADENTELWSFDIDGKRGFMLVQENKVIDMIFM